MKRLTLKTDHCGHEWLLRMWKGTLGCMGPSGPVHLQTCPEFSGLTQRWPLSPSEPICSLGQGGRRVVSSPRLSPIHTLVSTFSKKERREGDT